jgi:hypothetical protein
VRVENKYDGYTPTMASGANPRSDLPSAADAEHCRHQTFRPARRTATSRSILCQPPVTRPAPRSAEAKLDAEAPASRKAGSCLGRWLAQHIAASPYRLDIVVATRRLGELFAKHADEDIDDFDLVEMGQEHVLRYRRTLPQAEQFENARPQEWPNEHATNGQATL